MPPVRSAGNNEPLSTVETSFVTIRNQIKSGLKWSAASKAASQLVSWIATIYVIRLLVPGDYGLMAMATVVVAFLSTFHEFGLGSALIQARDLDEEKIGAVYGAMLLLGIALSGILAASSWWIAQFFDEPRLQTVMAVAGVQFILSAITIVPESMLRRNMQFRLLGIADLIGAITTSLSTLALALHGQGVWSLVLGNLLGALSRLSILVAWSPRRVRPNLRLRGVGNLLSYGGHITAARFLAYFMSQSDILIGAKLLGKDAIGLYSVAVNLASLPMEKAMGTINQVAFSAIARMQDQPHAVRVGLTSAIRLLFYLTLPAILGLASISAEFVPLVLGDKWIDSVLPLQLVAIVIPIRMMNGILFTAVTGLGYADVGFKNTLTGAVVLPLCFFVGAHWGVNGLAAAWVLGAPTVFALNFRRNSHVTGVSAKGLFSAISIPLFAALLMCLLILLTKRIIPIHFGSWLGLFSLVLFGAIVYGLVVIVIDSRLRDEIRSWQLVRRVMQFSRN